MKKIFALLLLVGITASCKKKEPEIPPITNLSAGTIYTVEQLRSIATCTNSCQRKFGPNTYLIGTILADETYGNFKSEAYLRDQTGTGAIHLDFIFSKSTYFIGDSVRVNLNGLDVWINSTTGMLEIDSIDFEKSSVKFGHGPAPEPKQISLSGVNYSDYLCDLVTVNGVAFLPSDAGQIWANPYLPSDLSRIFQDCVGNQVAVRTNYDCKFATEKTPTGYGSITGIATAYKGTNQMAIRKASEMNMNGTGCVVYLKKDFNDNSLTSGGWTNVSVTNGAVNWVASSFSGTLFAKVSGYTGGANTNSECWLIAPAINLSSSTNPIISFNTAAKFSGLPLEVWVSTDYVSGAPTTGTWTQLNGFALSPSTGSYVWTASGNASLSAFKAPSVRIAFKYKSTTAGATTYELDDINVREN
jgi:hypothetical protein